MDALADLIIVTEMADDGAADQEEMSSDAEIMDGDSSIEEHSFIQDTSSASSIGSVEVDMSSSLSNFLSSMEPGDETTSDTASGTVAGSNPATGGAMAHAMSATVCTDSRLPAIRFNNPEYGESSIPSAGSTSLLNSNELVVDQKTRSESRTESTTTAAGTEWRHGACRRHSRTVRFGYRYRRHGVRFGLDAARPERRR